MDKTENNKEYYTIDLLHIVKSLARRAWLIALCGLIAAVVGFSVAAFAIAPTYSASVKLYVNNSSISLGNFSITASELTAAQDLVRTYGEILDSRSTLEKVATRAGVDYSWKEISGMIEYAPSNETEIMKVTVTCEDPYEASKIANAISAVLKERIFEIMEATMEVVDDAVPDLSKVAPSVTKYTAIAFMLGVLGSVAVVVVFALMDDTIHDEEYLLRTYNYPILGKVPDLLNTGNKSYSYYSKKKKSTNK